MSKVANLDQLFGELLRLIAFGPGGEAVADEPGNSEPPVNGLSVGGVEDAVAWFLAGLTDMEHHRVLFLIGAPGNGKSYWSRRTAQESGLQAALAGAANRQFRKHSFVDGSGVTKLEIVNDATAPGATSDSTPTISDLAKAFETDTPILVNINRGVFYKEINHFESHGATHDELVAEAVLRALRGGTNAVSLDPTLGQIAIRENLQTPHETLQALRIDREGQRPILVLAVRMDLHSIFVGAPSYVADPDFFDVPKTKNSGRQYQLSSPFGSEFSESDYWATTPAGHLMAKEFELLNSLKPDALNPLNPISANLCQLSQSVYFSGILASLRNAEIVSTRHFAFRHLWTVLYLLILGDLRSQQGSSGRQILQGVDDEAAQLSDDMVERLWGLVGLAQYRFHQAIYGAEWSQQHIFGETRQSPQDSGRSSGAVIDVMAACDPTLDNSKSIELDGQRRVWSRGVRDAFMNALTDSESNSIVEVALKECHPDVAIEDLITDFDRELDRCIVHVLRADQSKKPLITRDEHDALLSWYGDYVTRLVAVSLGVTAWAEEISQFVGAWGAAAISPRLPDGLHRNIMAYVLPAFEEFPEANTRRLVTLLRSRTEPIRTFGGKPILAYELPTNIQTKARIRGDRLIVELIDFDAVQLGQVPKPLLSLDLNVKLIRELNVRASSNDAYSDVSASIVPLVERYRALATTNIERWALVTSRGVTSI